MPTVGNLIGVWQGLCGSLRISATAVWCDDLDSGLFNEPSLGGCRFSAWGSFKLSNDKAFAEKLYDVVGL